MVLGWIELPFGAGRKGNKEGENTIFRNYVQPQPEIRDIERSLRMFECMSPPFLSQKSVMLSVRTPLLNVRMFPQNVRMYNQEFERIGCIET